VRDRDGSVIVKAVNCSNEPQPYRLSVAGAPITRAAKTCFTGPDARASNSPLARERLRETTSDARLRAGAVEETLPPLSLTVYRLRR
jgi:hypothetical protein